MEKYFQGFSFFCTGLVPQHGDDEDDDVQKKDWRFLFSLLCFLNTFILTELLNDCLFVFEFFSKKNRGLSSHGQFYTLQHIINMCYSVGISFE